MLQLETMARTGFDDFFDGQMRDPAFADEYARARSEIDSVDGFMRALEATRAASGVSKAALARKSRLQPQTVRRLLTDETANPTIATVLNMLRPLSLGIQIVPLKRKPGERVRSLPKGRAGGKAARVQRAG